MSSSEEEELNNTIIEANCENKRRRGRPSICESLNKPRSHSESDIRKFLNKEGSEKKRKATNSPEYNGKDIKKPNSDKDPEGEMADHTDIIKILQERWCKEEEMRKTKEELETQRWEELSKKVDNSREELIKKMALMNERMKGEIEGLKKEIKEVKDRGRIEADEHKSKMAKLEEAMEDIRKKMKDETEKTKERTPMQGAANQNAAQSTQLERTNNKVEKEIKWLIEDAEREKKRKNITISGISISEPGRLKDWLEQKLGVKADVRKIWKIKDKAGSIGAQVASIDQKEEIMMKKNKLRTDKEKIYINNDTTWQERKNRKTVLEKARELREKGQECKIGHNKITTPTEELFWNERADRWFRKDKTEKPE